VYDCKPFLTECFGPWSFNSRRVYLTDERTACIKTPNTQTAALGVAIAWVFGVRWLYNVYFVQRPGTGRIGRTLFVSIIYAFLWLTVELKLQETVFRWRK
jgi:hypothetical protein